VPLAFDLLFVNAFIFCMLYPRAYSELSIQAMRCAGQRLLPIYNLTNHFSLQRQQQQQQRQEPQPRRPQFHASCHFPSTRLQARNPATAKLTWRLTNLLRVKRFAKRKLVMAALWNRAGHYIFILWFLSSIFFFFSSPNLSRRRLDVYHTCAHSVALVRI